MTDIDIRLLNISPYPFPNLFLRAPRPVYEIAADLDMRTVDNFDLRAKSFDYRNECRHLMVINDDDIRSTRSEGTAGQEPVALRIYSNPFIK